MKKLKTILVAGALSIGATVSILSTPASAAGNVLSNYKYYSGIDVYYACELQNGVPYNAVVVGPYYDVMSWKCQYRLSNGSYKYLGVDLDKYCRDVKGGRRAFYTEFSDPLSWGCYTKK